MPIRAPLPVNPATAAKEDLPIVFYGTSITQGGCATRPGMAFPAIIERKLHKETINLGFSGNGRMDKIMADKIASIPASAYVIDCVANCTYNIIKDSTDYFIRTIAEANPDTPIYMVSNYFLPYMYLDAHSRADAMKENELWRELCEKFRKEGYKNVRYIDVFAGANVKKSPIGPDFEACVDGIHFTDLGFLRFADVGGLYRTTDGGKNWALSTIGLFSSGATGMAIDPKNANRAPVKS